MAEADAKQQATGVAGYVSRQLDQDIHSSVKESEYVSAIHDNAEKFDPRTEEAFKYVQVSTTRGFESFRTGAQFVITSSTDPRSLPTQWNGEL